MHSVVCLRDGGGMFDADEDQEEEAARVRNIVGSESLDKLSGEKMDRILSEYVLLRTCVCRLNSGVLLMHVQLTCV